MLTRYAYISWPLISTILIFNLVRCQGPKGEPGAVGPQGPAGVQGAVGPAGANGTAITVVQFCPGNGSQYPRMFPEVGFCINNSIYAVYSANDGFLTLIPPGTYQSNAVGSTCDFTVLDNCEVKQ